MYDSIKYMSNERTTELPTEESDGKDINITKLMHSSYVRTDEEVTACFKVNCCRPLPLSLTTFNKQVNAIASTETASKTDMYLSSTGMVTIWQLNLQLTVRQ
jgi:hypothetical protein